MRLAIAVIVLVGALAIAALQVLVAASRTRSELGDERVEVERVRLAAARLHRAARGVIRHDPDSLYTFAEAQRELASHRIVDSALRRAATDYEYTLRVEARRHADGTDGDAPGRLAAFETAIEGVRGFDHQLAERSTALGSELADERDRAAAFRRYAQLLVLAGALAGIAATILVRRPRRQRRPIPPSSRQDPVELGPAPRFLE